MKRYCSLALAMAIGLLAAAQRGAVVVTEVCVANIDQTIDYSCNYGAWVELYNASDEDIALDGWYISDDAQDLTKHRLTGCDALRAGSYQCIFFDHNAAAGEYGQEAARQVRFKLARKGGELYLSHDGVSIDAQCSYPEAIARCSYARLSPESDEWRYCGLPTPGRAAEGHFAEEVLPLPEADCDSRLFTEPFAVRVGIPGGHAVRDSTAHPDIRLKLQLAERPGRKQSKWHLTATGSFGPALAQSEAMTIPINTSGMPQEDISSDAPNALPDHVGTWEEYSRYLNMKAAQQPDGPVDTLSRVDIASHNTGRIERSEHHYRPVTFGIALAWSITRRWSIETGLQYTRLTSQFAMGENGYSITDRQRLHYLGIPLRLTYRLADYRRLSAYGSAGATLHIPVYGTVTTDYIVGWQSTFTETVRIAPPLQWQTGVSLGVQYRFAPHFSLFAEPTFSWFIPSGSDTHTIWTEHPAMFTCPVGMRVTW